MKAEFLRIPPASHVFNRFLAVFPEIFIINATFISLIHGVVFSTSKKDDYPLLVSNVGWLGLLSVARLGGQRALGCGGAIIALLPNLMWHQVRTTENRSMGWGDIESFYHRIILRRRSKGTPQVLEGT
ncbi:hypothetical protein AMTR_s05677p00002800 [Amborella trichopoda]|uniref:Uncharacterized protein n=1 Tax=Amborella trichopoda TaxID=13333 RepID=U5CWZ7_AMBTC|nr:hypothetical protein AMTR_s05677p00002800 [Amborella trichopoda]